MHLTSKIRTVPRSCGKSQSNLILGRAFLFTDLPRFVSRPAPLARASRYFAGDDLIQGSGDEGYRPTYVFGQSNSYRYQRLFGELHLEGFEVSHTKDGFRWDENEQPFLELLRDHLDSEELPLLKQAEGYRSRAARSQLLAAAQQAVTNTTQAMEARLPTVLPSVADSPQVETPVLEPPEQPKLASRRFDVRFRERDWSIQVEITNDPGESQWLVLSDSGQVLDEPAQNRYSTFDGTPVHGSICAVRPGGA